MSVQDYYSITSNIFIKQTENNIKLKKRIDEICETDGSIAFIIELIYNHYEKGCHYYYMAQGMSEILNKLNVDPYEYGWGGKDNINCLQTILNFINKYIKVEGSKKEEYCGIKFFLTNKRYDDKKIYISVSLFSSEEEMFESGYTNVASDYIEFLNEYANFISSFETVDY